MTQLSTVLTIPQLLTVAEEVAQQAGKFAYVQRQQPRQLTSKGFRDFVTDVDIASQKMITDMIQAHFPEHGFLTEETDHDLPTDGPIIWVIDPIDGTTNYSHEMPLFAISIAAVGLTADGTREVLAGVVYDPMHDELFSAMRGQGAMINKRPLQVSQTSSLSEAILSLDWSHHYAQRQTTLDIINKVGHEVRTIRAIGTATLAICWIAAGRLDLYYNLNIKPWDVAACGLILQEVGGMLSSMQGETYRWDDQRHGCLASNGRVHHQFLSHIL